MKNIPKLIHKVIILDNMEIPEFPPEMNVAINSFRQLNPSYQLNIYGGNDCRKYLKKHFEPKILNAFDKIKAYAFKCDLMRYCLLYREGGIYSDMRQLCAVRFDNVFPDDLKWFTARDTDPSNEYCAFIMSVPKHPYLKEIIRLCVKNIKNEYYGENPLAVTSPVAFGKAVRKVDNKLIKTKSAKELLRCRYTGEHRGGKVFFEDTILLHTKYNNASGGDWSDFEQGNNYNTLWNSRQLYN